jgi:hypothetical protein
LTADDRVLTTSLRVEPNPWVHGVSDADLQAQYTFAREIQAKVIEANSAVIAIRRAKVQLEDRLAELGGRAPEEPAVDDRALREVAHSFFVAASEVEANIYQARNRSGQDPLNFPIKVNNRLANLLSMVERGDGAPNQGMREVFQIMVEELDGYTATLGRIWEAELTDVNRELERLGLEPLDPWDATTKLEAPEG